MMADMIMVADRILKADRQAADNIYLAGNEETCR